MKWEYLEAIRCSSGHTGKGNGWRKHFDMGWECYVAYINGKKTYEIESKKGVGFTETKYQTIKKPPEWHEWIDDAGKKGWELISVIEFDFTTFRYTFKRPSK